LEAERDAPDAHPSAGPADDGSGAPKHSDFIGNILSFIGGHIAQALADFDAIMTGETKIKGDIRMMYPRLPSHGVQVAISGLAARDIACHFVQVSGSVMTMPCS
jgi:hypothetical protein